MKTGLKSLAELHARFVPQCGLLVEDSAERFALSGNAAHETPVREARRSTSARRLATAFLAGPVAPLMAQVPRFQREPEIPVGGSPTSRPSNIAPTRAEAPSQNP